MQELSKLAILEILNDWNLWQKDFERYIPRPEYLNKLQLFRRSGEIIVLTGIRRSGKSTLLKQEMQDLLRNIEKKEILYINFEDPRFPDSLDVEGLQIIFDTYREMINPDGEVYLFLDEVQNVNNWERWVRTLYELKKAKIYLTGSSSKLLSGEIATLISGRYLKIDVYPLTFREFLSFNELECRNISDYSVRKIAINRLFFEYMKYGGFPKIATVEEELKREEILSYFNTILLKDILARYSIRNYEMLKRLVEYLLANDTKQNNINSISKALKYNYETVSDYINYVKQVYLLFELRNFNYSVKKQLRSDVKYYAIDTGFVNTVSFSFSKNIGRLYENIVFNELLRRGRDLFFLTDIGHECDFIVKKGNQITLAYQVCYELSENNLQREIAGLIMACKKFDLKEGYIVTESISETVNKEDIKIRIVPITGFLLGLEDMI